MIEQAFANAPDTLVIESAKIRYGLGPRRRAPQIAAQIARAADKGGAPRATLRSGYPLPAPQPATTRSFLVRLAYAGAIGHRCDWRANRGGIPLLCQFSYAAAGTTTARPAEAGDVPLRSR